MSCIRVEMTLCENTFFASREIYNYYETEGVIGHYALTYALNLCPSPYSPPQKPQYVKDLQLLNSKGIYVTPATVKGKARFVIQSFNANSDSYWFAFKQNAIAVEKNKRAYAVNYPQYGRAKLLAVGNCFTFYIITQEELQIPQYIRLGKFLSKAKLMAQKVDLQEEMVEKVRIDRFLCPLDLQTDHEIHSFDVLQIRPVILIKNIIISGLMYRIKGFDEFIPAHLAFGVDK